MNNKVCKCGHDVNEHQELGVGNACFHPMHEGKGIYCSCMNFEEDTEQTVKILAARVADLEKAIRIAVCKLEELEKNKALGWATEDVAEKHAAALVSYYYKVLGEEEEATK